MPSSFFTLEVVAHADAENDLEVKNLIIDGRVLTHIHELAGACHASSLQYGGGGSALDFCALPASTFATAV
eukprot:m.131549 g.131549  ORF g.131549 m.131549 type:complete len:71 (-) comp13917_c0_seq2:45-257(-)